MTINWLPWHGLWKDGQIALPNATQKAMDDPHISSIDAVGYGSVSLIRRPGWTAPERTPAEAAADAAAGKGWRGYGLISGTWRNLGGKRLQNGFVYFDPAGKAWWIQTAGVHQPRPPGHAQPDLCSISVTVRRFGLFDGKSHGSATLSAQTGSGVALPVATTWAPGDGTADLICHKSDGSEAIFGRTIFPSFWWGGGQLWPILFWRLTISGTGNEALPGFGLSIGWSIEYDEANYKFSNRTQVDELYPVYANLSGTKTDVGGNLKHIDSTRSGGTMYDKTTVRTSRQQTKLWPAYTAADALVWLESEYVWQETISEVKEYQVLDGVAHLYDLGGGNYDQDPFSIQEVTTTTTTPSATMTLRYGGVTIHSVSKSSAPVVNVNTFGPYNVFISLASLGDPPGGLPMGTFSGTLDLGDDVHTDNTVTSSFGQGTSGWGIGYPFALGSPAGSNYRNVVAVRYSNQVIGLIELDVPTAGATSPVTRQQLVDAWAPSGAHAAFSVPAPRNVPQTARKTGSVWDGRFASWHPVTDALAIDTAPICWF